MRFPPGRARLVTRPIPRGSPAAIIKIGIVDVAFLAADGANEPIVTITSTFSPTSSLAMSGTRSSVIVRKSTLEDKGFSLNPTQLSKSFNKDRSYLGNRFSSGVENANPENLQLRP